MKTQVSLAEQLKAELMERYGLREDQVRLELSVYTKDMEKANTILADYSRDKEFIPLTPEKDCTHVFGNLVNNVFVHNKDGFYSFYNNEGEDNE
jgi:hypothetical protein